MITAKFGAVEAQNASDSWGFNCGPGAVCGLLGMTPDELRPYLGDFERKRYTNPRLMRDVLRNLGRSVRQTYRSDAPGTVTAAESALVRVQWAGPWTKPEVPMIARQRWSHWVAVAGSSVFDVNAISIGGWITRKIWEERLVPWLISNCCPKGDGQWWPTHVWEVS